MAIGEDLRGAVAVVTGASGNLGPVWIGALAGAGATVAGLDLRPDAVEGAAEVLVADVTDRAQLEGAREEIVARYGVPRVLINNAGIDQPPAPGVRSTVQGIGWEELTRTLEVNLAGTFAAIQAFGPAMADAGRGAIVNIGSLYAGIAPEPAFYDHLPGFLKPPAYGASKAGVLALTRYFARLWGPHGVRCNALSPGSVAGGQDPEFLAKFTARVALRRMAQSADLVGPLLFLASEASAYMTGQELLIDGGFTV